MSSRHNYVLTWRNRQQVSSKRWNLAARLYHVTPLKTKVTFLGAFALSWIGPINFIMSVLPSVHLSARIAKLPLEFPSNLISEIFMEIRRQKSKYGWNGGRKYRALYTKTLELFVFAGDIKLLWERSLWVKWCQAVGTASKCYAWST